VLAIIDNYDSFTYNLVQYLGELGQQYAAAASIEVYRNDCITPEALRQRQPEGIVISPGPGTPDDAGISLELVRTLGPNLPILGVCLGHQCIGQAFGASIAPAPELMHGKTSQIHHQGDGIFAGLARPFVATRYHSLVIAPESLPAALETTAWAEDGTLMGIRHRNYPHLQGVQFHPESILTDAGKQLLANFLATLEQPALAAR